MADANTTRYGLVKPEISASADSWGSKLNQDYDDIDVLLGAITTTGSANAYLLTTGLSLAAYVSGQSFLIKPNHANTGAATINVDGLGAKDLRKNGTTALASGDLATDQYYRIAYNGTQFQIVGAVTGLYQPLDATLTALAALSWSSGNALLQFTAADTVSLTLTPSVTTLTTASTTATTAGVIARNTTDNASVLGLRIEGDRATPANNDAVYAGFFLSDSAGNQDEMGRITYRADVVTSGAESVTALFAQRVAGSFTTVLALETNNLSPQTNDGLALGTTTRSYADLFLASGGVINFNNGGVTLTHDATSDGLEVAGGSFRARIALSTETSGTLTSASANKRVKATAGVTINDGVFTAEDSVEIYNDSDLSITITQDTGMTLRLAGSTSTGNRTLAARGIAYVYFDTNADAAVAGSGVS